MIAYDLMFEDCIRIESSDISVQHVDISVSKEVKICDLLFKQHPDCRAEIDDFI